MGEHNERIRVQDLDTPLSELFGCENTETPREFIVNSEKEFGMCHRDLDVMDEDTLNHHFYFLNELWNK